MKRSIITIGFAVAAATASADTSVTLSGDLKVAGAYGNGGTTSIDGSSPDHWGLNDLLSFFGLSGKQDLPNNTYASFELDSFLRVDNGSSWSDTGGPFFSRRATVSFGSKFGEIYGGRALTPSQLVGLMSDPWGWDGSTAQVGWMMQQANYTSTQFLRTNNTLGYVSPKVSGFTLSLADSAGEKTRSKDLGASLTYDNGPLWLGIGYDQSHGNNNDPTLNHTVILGAGYDFGVVRPLASYTSSKVLGSTYNAYSLGFTAPVNGGVLRGEYAHLDDFDTVTPEKQGSRKFGIGYQWPYTKSVSFFGNVASAKADGLTATNSAELGIEYGF